MIGTRSLNCQSGERALLIGCHGGVGQAVLALLERTAPGRRLAERLDALLLVDCRSHPQPVCPAGARLLPPATITSAEDLTRLVREHRVTQVIDVSSIDTVECCAACDTMGVDFLCTSVEEWPARGSGAADRAIERLLRARRSSLGERGHLVGSGANPGIVNALVFAALEAFAARAGVETSQLDLHSILITEEDTTTELDAAMTGDRFAMTWSPAHCLDELFEPRAFAARDGAVLELGHAPGERWYRARCGQGLVEGLAVPHEEVVTLSRRLPGVVFCYLYRLPPAARIALASHPERRSVGAWTTRRMYPPWARAIAGKDQVGVLLCSRHHGELWMGFRTDVSEGLAFGTNATELQVAAGVLAGWTQLGRRRGISFVEDLDWKQFLRVAAAVLGPPLVVHDVCAPPRLLADRAVRPSVRPSQGDGLQPAPPTTSSGSKSSWRETGRTS